MVQHVLPAQREGHIHQVQFIRLHRIEDQPREIAAIGAELADPPALGEAPQHLGAVVDQDAAFELRLGIAGAGGGGGWKASRARRAERLETLGQGPAQHQFGPVAAAARHGADRPGAALRGVLDMADDSLPFAAGCLQAGPCRPYGAVRATPPGATGVRTARAGARMDPRSG